MSEFETLAERQLGDPHYLKKVTTLGDSHPIVANRDIHASTGLKLVSAGMRVNSSLYERLLQHKLIPALDQCVTMEGAVTTAILADKAEQMIERDRRLSMIGKTRLDGQTLPQVLKQIPLNPAIAFKLTVMRETNPELFEHSLYVALVSTYIGMQMEMNRNQLVDLATAALLHDVGILHVDPRLLERNYRMSEVERRHLYVHSITGWMILKAYPEYRPKVQEAVLQHHERLDGSGYPRGLKAGEIGQFGQIIAVAEIVASRFGGEDGEYGWSRLETILKLNQRRYGGNLVHYLKVFYHEDSEVPPCSEVDKATAKDKMVRIAAIFRAWEMAQQGCDPAEQVCRFIDERMGNLKLEILDAGLPLDAADAGLLGLEEDARACFDARVLLDETLWQLRNIQREARRRWPSIDAAAPARGAAAAKAWMDETAPLL